MGRLCCSFRHFGQCEGLTEWSERRSIGSTFFLCVSEPKKQLTSAKAAKQNRNYNMANYSLMWGSKAPGHLIYLIDQSGSMYGQNEIKAAEAVHAAIMDTFRGCVQGTEIRNRVYITIIGYGNEQGVSIIREGWMTDFVEDPFGSHRSRNGQRHDSEGLPSVDQDAHDGGRQQAQHDHAHDIRGCPPVPGMRSRGKIQHSVHF